MSFPFYVSFLFNRHSCAGRNPVLLFNVQLVLSCFAGIFKSLDSGL